MKHKEYIAVSEKVAEQLNNHLIQFCNKYPAFKKISKEYTKKRIHLNAIQFYAGFKASNSKEKYENYYNIPIAIECIMLMAYKTNRILDHKQEVWSSEDKIKETVLDERIYLSLILSLLEDSKKNIGEKYNFIKDLILKIIVDINCGFWIERNYLNVNFSPFDDVLKNRSSKYKKRNVLFNSVYDYAPLIGYYLGSGDETIFKKYEDYFRNKDKISHSGQIINDLSDYSSAYDENVKSYQDAFSDIRNGIITQPTFELIKETAIIDALKEPNKTKDASWRTNARDLLTKKNVIKKVMKMTKKAYYHNISFWKNKMKVDSGLLFYTYLFLLKNKYYYDFLRK